MTVKAGSNKGNPYKKITVVLVGAQLAEPEI